MRGSEIAYMVALVAALLSPPWAVCQCTGKSDEEVLAAAGALRVQDIASLSPEARAGSADAQLMLGLAHLLGRGAQQNYAEALTWMKRAADQGCAPAQKNLGKMYYEGLGTQRTLTEAFRWFSEAAQQGYAAAEYDLAVMYRRGEGVPQDPSRALEWYRKAAGHGDADAMYCVGTMYENGEGVSADHQEAMRWFRKAAAKGNPSATSLISIEEADSRAKAWLEKHHKEHPEMEQLAEGTYRTQSTPASGAKTGPGEAYDFQDNWTLWRSPDGNLEVEGRLHFLAETLHSSPDFRYWMALLAGGQLLEFKWFIGLRLAPEMSPLACSNNLQQILCVAGPAEAKNRPKAEVGSAGTSQLFWPLSLFSIAGIARFGGRKPETLTTLYSPDEVGGSNDLVFQSEERLVLMPWAAKIRYLGREWVKAAGQEFAADKYQIDVRASYFHDFTDSGVLVQEEPDPKSPYQPYFLVWISPEGLPLIWDDPKNPGARVELVSYNQYRKF